MVNDNSTERDQFAKKGFCIAKKVLPPNECQRLASLFSDSRQAGRRDLFHAFPELQALVLTKSIRTIVESLLGPESFAVKALLFDKSPSANWYVTWHQDLTICVKEKHEVAGFGPWSEKEGVIHVQPPIDILQRIITLRIHLDACHDDNGPLRVIAGSHRDGILDSEAIASQSEQHDSMNCCVEAGDCVVISPLILHASSKAVNPDHRRVLHLEFANIDFPEPLQWYEQW